MKDMLQIKTALPEDTGLSSKAIVNFAKTITDAGIPLHSFAVLHKDKLIAEYYYAPFKKETLHRMFSISKSFTAIAIGLLMDEGKLSLDDKIIDYFPDYCPKEIHPYLRALTIRNCLEMRTCYNKTTYTIGKTHNWAESFFNGTPVLMPGTLFHYDTSSAQALCALVERLTEMPMLDYLKKKLPSLGLSKESYMLTDPSGCSIGGSGLVATTQDLINMGYFLIHEGNINGKQLIDKDYLRLITSKISDTQFTMSIPAEKNGYGMQFWRYYKDGYMCYGMGGQFIIVLPKEELVLITTADTQGLNHGNQTIHDSFMQNIVASLSAPVSKKDADALAYFEHATLTPVLDNGYNTLLEDQIHQKTYVIDKNAVQFDKVSFDINETKGTLSYSICGKPATLSFGFGYHEEGIFPDYNMRYLASAAWVTDKVLYIKFEIIDSFLGTVHMNFSFYNDEVTIELKKIVEGMFEEYQGIYHGKLQ